MATVGQTTFTVYPVQNYNFGTKSPQVEKDSSVQGRMARMQEKYRREGLRRTVEAILLVQAHNHLHVLLLQVNSMFFKLPGGRLRPGEDEVEGLQRKLNNKLAPTSTSLRIDWQVGECAGVWWRPNFENPVYPYLAPHITRPKEVRRMYVVTLPEKCYFAVPKNMRLLAVPLFELYDNVPRYGPAIASIPVMLSRFRVNMASSGRLLSMGLAPAPLLNDHAGAAANGSAHGGGGHNELMLFGDQFDDS